MVQYVTEKAHTTETKSNTDHLDHLPFSCNSIISFYLQPVYLTLFNLN